MVLSPPDAAVVEVISLVLTPEHMVSPVAAISPAVKTGNTVTVHVPVEAVGVVLQVASLA